jgi:porin
MENLNPRQDKSGWCKFVLVLLAIVLSMSILAAADEPMPTNETATVASDTPAPAPAPEQSSYLNLRRIENSPYMFGDWGGERTKLAEEKGISFTLFQHTDLMGAVSGGNDQGFGVWNRIRGIASVDMGKLAHVKGLSIMATGTWNNGTDVGYDQRYLGALFVTTGNDTVIHQVRLDQWWVQQDLFNNKLSLRVGQLGMETYFGWMPSGLNHFMLEPLFYAPLGLLNAYDKPDIHNSAPAAMVTITPNKHFSYQAGVVSLNLNGAIGNGVAPKITDGVSWINDFAFRYGQPAKAADVKDYSGEMHLGFSYTGVSIKDFAFVKPGITSNGNAGYYANIIQPVYRVKAGSNRGLDVRAMYVWGPESKGVLAWDKQLVLSAIFNGPIPSRPKDSINIGLNSYMIRNYLNTPARLASNLPVTSERDYEVNYACWATNWWNLMPVVAVIQNLNANPRRGNGVMFGLRSFINF